MINIHEKPKKYELHHIIHKATSTLVKDNLKLKQYVSNQQQQQGYSHCKLDEDILQCKSRIRTRSLASYQALNIWDITSVKMLQKSKGGVV
jgi:hypothetical protein